MVGLYSPIRRLGVVSCLTYVIVFAVQLVCRPQNLKTKYNAKWALVTGASSGIEKSISARLAQQGINVVLVTLDDGVLAATFPELQQKYPTVEFRKVGCSLAPQNEKEYMKPIRDATAGLDVNLIFNNAGYILAGLTSNLKWARESAQSSRETSPWGLVWSTLVTLEVACGVDVTVATPV